MRIFTKGARRAAGSLKNARMADSPPDPPDTLATRWRWALPAALFLVVTILYANTAAFSVISLDVRSANIASWRIAESGTPWIEGLDLPVLDNDQRATWVIEPAANGHSVIGRSPGTVIAGLPAYWIFGSTTLAACRRPRRQRSWPPSACC